MYVVKQVIVFFVRPESSKTFLKGSSITLSFLLCSFSHIFYITRWISLLEFLNLLCCFKNTFLLNEKGTYV